MDKTIVGLLGAVGAVVAASPGEAAVASPHDVLQAASYAELLRPIPNALQALKALDATPARVEDAQYYPYYQPPVPQYGYYNPYYHHHHHHRYYQRYYHHHHHHHHHHGYGRFER